MTARPQAVILSGSQAIDAARAIEQQKKKQSVFPFEWSYPPPNSAYVFREASITTPAAAIQTLILEYDVPDSQRFVLDRLVLWFTTTYQPGDFTFVVDVNRPLGFNSAQGTPLRGFGALQNTFGNLYRAEKVNGGELDILKPRDQLRVKVTNNTLGAGGAFFVARFFGYNLT